MKATMRKWAGAMAVALLCGPLAGHAQSSGDGEPAFQPPSPITYGLTLELGDLGQVRKWLDQGLPPDYEADQVGTGLMVGAREGNIALMELMLARGANLEAVNNRGEQALLLAAWKGQLAAVKWLVEHGAKVNRDPLQWTALHYAVFAGYQEVADYLMDQGAEINARSPNGSSVLMMAAYEGKDQLAVRLMERGADPKIQNENGHTALDWAMKYDHTKVARVITNPEEFITAANRPRDDWGVARKSEKVPAEIQKLLEVRRAMEAKGYDLSRVDQRIANARAKYARGAVTPQEQTPAMGLEISASRAAPGQQQAKLVTVPRPAAKTAGKAPTKATPAGKAKKR